MALKNTDCTMGAKVALDQRLLPMKRGVVAGPVTTHPTAGEVVIVEWPADWGANTLQKVTLRSLITDAEANKVEAELQVEADKLKAKQDKLNAEFEATSKEIAKKLKAAAKSITEAGNLADKAGKDLTTDFYDATRELERAMDGAGWSTSSWHC